MLITLEAMNNDIPSEAIEHTEPSIDSNSICISFIDANATLNRQAGAAIALCDNGAKRNDHTKQAPRRTVRVEVP